MNSNKTILLIAAAASLTAVVIAATSRDTNTIEEKVGIKIAYCQHIPSGKLAYRFNANDIIVNTDHNYSMLFASSITVTFTDLDTNAQVSLTREEYDLSGFFKMKGARYFCYRE